MTQSDVEILRNEIREGFRTVNENIADVRLAVDGVMVKMLHHTEVDEITAKMKHPPKKNGKH